MGGWVCFSALVSPSRWATLPMEGKEILVGQVLVHNNCADNISNQWEDVMARQIRVGYLDFP